MAVQGAFLNNPWVLSLRSISQQTLLGKMGGLTYDDITRLASLSCKTPVALITLMDEESSPRLKERTGVLAAQRQGEEAFCACAMLVPSEVMVIPDTKANPRFALNPLVAEEPYIRFYAGAPLVISTRKALGVLCVMDLVPRFIDHEQREILGLLAHQVATQIELRNDLNALDQYVTHMEEYGRSIEQAQAEIKAQSLTDNLTRLNNRWAFDQRLEEEMARAQRQDTPLAVALLDVDRFKTYNDTFSHLAGDEVLRKMGEILKQCVRPYDFAARYGGDEFVILLPGITSDGALVIAERIRRTIEKSDWPKGPITGSIGVAVTAMDIPPTLNLLALADQALYHAKEIGRNRVSFANVG